MITRSIGTALILSAAVTTLSGGGCSSGGGGGSGGGGAEPFISFSDVVAGQDTEMDAETRVADYTSNVAGLITSVSASEEKDGTFTFRLDNSDDFTRATLTIPDDPAPAIRISFNTASGDVITDGVVLDPIAMGYYVAASASFDELAIISDQNLMGFEYQSYGVWLNGIDVGMGVIAASTAGAATHASDIPIAGVANYSGASTGVYVDPAGNAFFAFADFSANVDFGTLAMNVASTNTQVLDTVTDVTSANSDLNYAGAGNVGMDGSFNAAIAATDLAGSLDGKFYGPAAEELGGTFDMSGMNGRYIGAVGAAQ